MGSVIGLWEFNQKNLQQGLRPANSTLNMLQPDNGAHGDAEFL
jgi:hypothetical protein